MAAALILFPIGDKNKEMKGGLVEILQNVLRASGNKMG